MPKWHVKMCSHVIGDGKLSGTNGRYKAVSFTARAWVHYYSRVVMLKRYRLATGIAQNCRVSIAMRGQASAIDMVTNPLKPEFGRPEDPSPV